MLIIAHRANISGPAPETENSPQAIREALDLNFHVEVDVWMVKNRVYLGHDAPKYHVDEPLALLKRPEVWAHAKNHAALVWCLGNGIRTFAHDADPYVFTSDGYIWCHLHLPPPESGYTDRHIVVRNAEHYVSPVVLRLAGGVCTDYPMMYRLAFD